MKKTTLKKIHDQAITKMMNNVRRYRKNSQKWRILAIMSTYPNRWYRPEDFMQYFLTKAFWVGYEANSRLSELTRDGILEDKYMEERGSTRSRKKLWRLKKEYVDVIRKVASYKEAKKMIRRLFSPADWKKMY